VETSVGFLALADIQRMNWRDFGALSQFTGMELFPNSDVRTRVKPGSPAPGEICTQVYIMGRLRHLEFNPMPMAVKSGRIERRLASKYFILVCFLDGSGFLLDISKLPDQCRKFYRERLARSYQMSHCRPTMTAYNGPPTDFTTSYLCFLSYYDYFRKEEELGNGSSQRRPGVLDYEVSSLVDIGIEVTTLVAVDKNDA